MNYYEILESSPSATYEELKNSYRKLVKLVHPDKQTADDTRNEFVRINEAWKVLRDDKLRKEYDASLMQDNINAQHLIYAEVNESDLEFNGELVAKYLCRCGVDFIIDKNDLSAEGNEELIIECEECTNCILIRRK